MKIERLQSGSYRTRVTVNKNGKKKVVSITGPTKGEVASRAALVKGKPWALMTVEEACGRFLELRRPALSPSTLRGYLGTMKLIENDVLGAVKIERLTTPIIQKWVNDMDVSKKTKKNHLGFLIAALRFNEVDKTFRVKCGDEMKKTLYTPTIEEVNRVLDVADPELHLAMVLGCLGLRRGELCALTAADVDRETCLLNVTKAYAKTPEGTFVLKKPKTPKSIRPVRFPSDLLSIIPEEGRLIDCSPDCITNRFVRAVKKAGVTPFRFHDLRSFSASVSLVLGASKASVKASHGWETDRMLDTRYDRPMKDQLEKDERTKVLYLQNNLHIKRG